MGTAPSWSWLLAPDHRFEVIPQVAVVNCHKAPNVKRSKLHLARLVITRVRGLFGASGVSEWVSCVPWAAFAAIQWTVVHVPPLR